MWILEEYLWESSCSNYILISMFVPKILAINTESTLNENWVQFELGMEISRQMHYNVSLFNRIVYVPLVSILCNWNQISRGHEFNAETFVNYRVISTFVIRAKLHKSKSKYIRNDNYGCSIFTK